MDSVLVALQNIATLERMLFLFSGVIMGLALGAMPGLGGLVGLTILLPFTFDMDPYAAFAVMIGLISVTITADTISSVLFGVPGTAASQATIMEVHPMAKKGEAGKAFGAAYTSSLMGGLLGALILAVCHHTCPSAHRSSIRFPGATALGGVVYVTGASLRRDIVHFKKEVL